MKLQNKKTGEIVRVEFLNNWQTDDGTVIGFRVGGTLDVYSYNSLTELNEEWEDYEEPKELFYITAWGDVMEYAEREEDRFAENQKKVIGNYFETREEAEKAVEKLKAWKRLKDKGFRFTGWTIDDGLRISICSNIGEEDVYDDDKRKIKPDLDLLFGGEE